MKYLTKEDILFIHEEIIATIGGTPGLRDEKLLDSAVNSIKQTMFGKDLYPSLTEKAIVLAEKIIKNHPFVDGNKRTGIAALKIFLDINGIRVDIDEDILYKIAIGFASGKLKREEAINMIDRELKKNINESKDASKIYTDFKYLNLEGLDLSKYEKMNPEKGWKELEKELLKRVKEGVKINDDVLDEIDVICADIFADKMEYIPWKEVNKKIEERLNAKV